MTNSNLLAITIFFSSVFLSLWIPILVDKFKQISGYNFKSIFKDLISKFWAFIISLFLIVISIIIISFNYENSDFSKFMLPFSPVVIITILCLLSFEWSLKIKKNWIKNNKIKPKNMIFMISPISLYNIRKKMQHSLILFIFQTIFLIPQFILAFIWYSYDMHSFIFYKYSKVEMTIIMNCLSALFIICSIWMISILWKVGKTILHLDLYKSFSSSKIRSLKLRDMQNVIEEKIKNHKKLKEDFLIFRKSLLKDSDMKFNIFITRNYILWLRYIIKNKKQENNFLTQELCRIHKDFSKKQKK